MTTSLREAVERLQSLNLTADAALPMSFSWVRPDVETLLSAIQEAREALGPFVDACDSADEGAVDNHAHCWESAMAMSVTYGDFRRAAEVFRALSPGGAEQ